MDVLSRVLPFFLLVAVGAVVARARLIDLAGARALSAYVFWVAFPALLIHSLSAMPPPDGRLAQGLLAYAAAATAPLFVALLAGRMLGWSREARTGAAMASVGGNTAFLGAPLAVSLFGPAAAAPAAALVAVDFTLIMTLATATLRGGGAEGGVLKAMGKTFQNPVVVAALVGTAMALMRMTAVEPVDKALGLLAATASPVGLVALGLVVGLEAGRPAREDAGPVTLAVAFKLLLTPTLVWLAVGLTDAEPLFRTTATLLAACPTAVSVFIQTRTYGLFSRGGALAVVLATLCGAVSLPIIGALLA